MSVNSWVIFQLDLSRGQAKKLLERTPLDCHLQTDCYRVLYEENRYREFVDLAPEERSAKLELYLGEGVLKHLKQPGVYVVPEVGQSFKGMTFVQMTGHGSRAPALFVKCLPGQEASTHPDDPTEEGIVAVLEWVKAHKKRQPEVANELMKAILEANWKHLGSLCSARDGLKKFAKAFEDRRGKAAVTDPEPIRVADELRPLLPADANVLDGVQRSGSRAWQRQYSQFSEEIFGDPFADIFLRKSFGSPNARFAFVYASTDVAPDEVAASLRAQLAKYDEVIEERQMKTLDKVWVTALRADARVLAIYRREKGETTAHLCIFRMSLLTRSRSGLRR